MSLVKNDTKPYSRVIIPLVTLFNPRTYSQTYTLTVVQGGGGGGGGGATRHLSF